MHASVSLSSTHFQSEPCLELKNNVSHTFLFNCILIMFWEKGDNHKLKIKLKRTNVCGHREIISTFLCCCNSLHSSGFRLFTRFWNLAAEIFSNIDTRALARSNSATGWQDTTHLQWNPEWALCNHNKLQNPFIYWLLLQRWKRSIVQMLW